MSAKGLKVGRIPFLAAGIISLVAALWAALLRLGFMLPVPRATLPGAHGPLMVAGFLGTLIGLERAVALGEGWAYSAPGLTGLGGLLLIAGVGGAAGPLLILLGSLGLVLNFALILRCQTEVFTVTMALGAVAWVVGNALWLGGLAIPGVVVWWMGFLVLTIMGERLELSRMRGPSGHDRAAFIAATALFCLGLMVWFAAPAVGLLLTGVGMIAYGGWVARYDIALRTVRLKGLPQFVAVNLLAGAFWLAVGGVLRVIFPAELNLPQYDALLHSVFLGFVFSMIFAHAPIIFPAILGKPLPFKKIFYLHVVLLHLSLALRVGADLGGSVRAWQWGGALNVIALLVFLANTVRGVIEGLARPGPAPQSNPTLGLPAPPATTESAGS